MKGRTEERNHLKKKGKETKRKENHFKKGKKLNYFKKEKRK